MKKSILLFILGSLIAFFACERNEEFKPESDVMNLRDSCATETEEVYSSTDRALHFTDSESYNEFRQFCPGLPNIDFNHYSVIGYFTTAQACSVSYSREVLNHDVSGSVTLLIEMETFGDCRVNHDSWNLMRIPRIDSTTNVMVRVFRDEELNR